MKNCLYILLFVASAIYPQPKMVDTIRVTKRKTPSMALSGAIKATSPTTTPTFSVSFLTDSITCFDYEYVNQKPQFRNGEKEMKLYILANTKYPYSVCNVKGPKSCIVNFIVEKDGSITNLSLLKKVTGNWLNSDGTYTKDSPLDCPDYDNEAIRVIKSMQRFSPGKQGGKTVRVSMQIEVKFYAK